MFSVKSFCYQNFAHPLQPLVKMLVLEVCRGGECGDWREKDAFCLLNTHSLITAEYAH